MTAEADALRATVEVVTKAILDVLQEDDHHWSSRPCGSCRAISSMIGRPFGWYEYARRMAAGEPPRRSRG